MPERPDAAKSLDEHRRDAQPLIEMLAEGHYPVHAEVSVARGADGRERVAVTWTEGVSAEWECYMYAEDGAGGVDPDKPRDWGVGAVDPMNDRSIRVDADMVSTDSPDELASRILAMLPFVASRVGFLEAGEHVSCTSAEMIDGLRPGRAEQADIS